MTECPVFLVLDDVVLLIEEQLYLLPMLRKAAELQSITAYNIFV